MYDASAEQNFEKAPGASGETGEISQAQQEAYDKWTSTMDGLSESNPWTDLSLEMGEPSQFAGFSPAETAPASADESNEGLDYSSMPGIDMYDKDRNNFTDSIDESATEVGDFLSDATDGAQSDALDQSSGSLVMRDLIKESINGDDGIGLRGTEQSLKMQGLSDMQIGSAIKSQAISLKEAETQAQSLSENASDHDKAKVGINAATAASANALLSSVRANEAATAIINEDPNSEQLIQESKAAAADAQRLAETAIAAAQNIENPEELAGNIAESARETIQFAKTSADKIEDAQAQLDEITTTKEQIADEVAEEEASADTAESIDAATPETTETTPTAEDIPVSVDTDETTAQSIESDSQAVDTDEQQLFTPQNPLNSAVDQLADRQKITQLEYRQGSAPTADEIRRAMLGEQ